MALFKCKMCGGALEIEGNQTIATCEYCGTQQTLPKLDDDRRISMYERANHFRRNNEFDKAMGIYEQILNEDNTDAEAYWSLVLCRYGIEYVEDPDSHRHIPTVNRAQFTSIYDDENYQAAIKNADALQRGIYEVEANAINEIQKGILAISQKEEPFDVFICYKETDNRGLRTMDSVLAQDIYEQLKSKGLKVFFARITLEDKLGSAYEPYIFAALNSAKVMLVIGTKPDHFNAVWVKNEWSRYLSLVNHSRGDKLLIPVYKDMDPYNLPKEFAHLQAQDMNKIGFMQDLVRGIKKVVGDSTPTANITTAALLERMRGYLEDGDWDNAEEYAERVLDIDPKSAEANLGLLLVDLKLINRTALADCEETFESNKNYKKAIRHADEALLAELQGYIAKINKRIADAAEAKRLEQERAQREKERIAEQQRIKREKNKKTAIKSAILIPICIVFLGLITYFILIPGYGLASRQYGYLIRLYQIEEFEVPYGVENIPDEAFKECYSLKKVTIPNSVTSIGDSAFSHCHYLTSITIPDSVTSIGDSAFSYCVSLTNINIPDSVTSIGDNAFYGCSSLAEVNIPDSVTTIGEGAFSHCTSLTEINIPDSVTTIGEDAFLGCLSLTEVKIPDSVTTIGERAFFGCSSLTEVNIPDSVNSIGDCAFYVCTSLTEINIPDSVTSIGNQAFDDCTSLTKVIIPESVVTVGLYAFPGHNNLTVYCRENNKPDGWYYDWIEPGDRKVVWGYTGN